MNKLKRIIAIACIVILVGLYIATFITAIIDNSISMTLFKGCVACTIFVPIAAYFYIWLHKYAMKRSGRKDYDSSTDDSVKDKSSND